MTPDGQVLWEKQLTEHWPGGHPDCIPKYSFHMGCPASVFRGAERDWIIYNEAGWPYLIDSDGQMHYAFAWQKEAAQVRIAGIETRPDDYGYGYHVVVDDIDEDGQEEIIVHDRQGAWIFGQQQ